MIRILFLYCFFVVSSFAYAQTLMEYFFNQDPGIGNGKKIEIHTTNDFDFGFEINYDSLQDGLNTIGLRLYDGKWSHTITKSFFVSRNKKILKCEYLIDYDLGPGNGYTIYFPPEKVIDFANFIDVEKLQEGYHKLFLRVYDGQWSQTLVKHFYLIKNRKIQQAEYFINNDLGPGKCEPLEIIEGNIIEVDRIINNLTEGFQTIGIRVKDKNWGQTFYKKFFVAPAEKELKYAEYFFNNDPGRGKALPLNISNSSIIDVDSIIDLELHKLSSGNHILYIRLFDDNWSHIYSHQFCLTPQADFSADTVDFQFPATLIATTKFNNQSTTYLWDFESDGVIDLDNSKFAYHYYNAPGEYQVTLIAGSFDACFDTIKKNLVVKADSFEVKVIVNYPEACEVIGEGKYLKNSNVFLSFTLNNGYDFSHWEINGYVFSYSNYVFIILNQDTTINLVFRKKRYQVNIQSNVALPGIISGPLTYEHGDTVRLIVNKIHGFVFKHISVNDSIITYNDTLVFVIDEDKYFWIEFAKQQINVSIEVNDTTLGKVFCRDSIFYFGDIYVFVPISAYNSKFDYWQINDSTIIKRDTLYINFSEDTRLKAFFSLKQIEVSINVEPSGAGYVGGAGTYNFGEKVIITAYSNEGIDFSHFEINGQIITSEYFEFFAHENTNIKAVFKYKVFNLQLSSNLDTTGILTGEGLYYWNDTVTIQAFEPYGYVFMYWSENDSMVSQNKIYSFRIRNNKHLIAHFEKKKFNCSVWSNNIDYGKAYSYGSCSYLDELFIQAIPEESCEFLYWTSNGQIVSYTPAFSLIIKSDTNLIAHFRIKKLQVKLNVFPPNGGKCYGEGIYDYDSEVTITAEPSKYHKFAYWMNNKNEIVSTDSIYSFYLIDNVELTAVFIPQKFTVNVSANFPEGVEIIGAGYYDYNTEVTIIARIKKGFKFEHWSIDGNIVSYDTVIKVTVFSDIDIYATLSIITYNVITLVKPDGAGQVSGGGIYLYEALAQLIATPNEGYVFEYWEMNGQKISTDSILLIRIVDNYTITAYFKAKTFYLKLVSIPKNAATLVGEGKYEYNDTVTIKAIPFSGYEFIHWEENGKILSDSTIHTFIIKEDKVIYAYFKKRMVVVSTIVNPPEGGTTEGQGIYEFGSLVTLKATPNKYYRFVNWTFADSIAYSTDSLITFYADRDITFRANFIKVLDDVMLKVETIGRGEITPYSSGTYKLKRFTNITLTAIANKSTIFSHWLINDSIAYNNPLELTLHSDMNIYAIFVDKLKNENLTIYPVPTKDFVHIVFENEITGKIYIYLTNTLGQIVYEKYFEKIKTLTIDVSKLNPGIYELRISYSNKDYFEKIIVY